MGKESLEDIRGDVQCILNETFKVEKSLMNGKSLLKDDLGLDSVDLLDVVGLAEKKFNVKILSGGSLRTSWPLTIEDLARIIEDRLRHK